MFAPWRYNCTFWGDEFTILLEDIQEKTQPMLPIASKGTDVPFNLSGHEVFTAASIASP